MKMHQMIKRSPLFLLGLLGLTLFSSPVAAQVAAGPSDPASFGTVIDAPADIDFQLIHNGILESLSNGSAAPIEIPEGVDLPLILNGILESLGNGSPVQIDIPEGVDLQLILNAIIQSLANGSPAPIDIPEGVDFQLILNEIIQILGNGSTVQINISEGVELGNSLFAFSGYNNIALRIFNGAFMFFNHKKAKRSAAASWRRT